MPRPRPQPLTLRAWPRRSRRAFTMAEMLVVMAIITILAASLAVIVPMLRTNAMRKAAEADIHLMSMTLVQYYQDRGTYPSKPFSSSTNEYDYMDFILYKALTDPNYNLSGHTAQAGAGWGSARDDWQFIRGESAANSRILDPWGVPYYYLPFTDYLYGVRIHDTSETASTNPDGPPVYGATPRKDDYSGDHNSEPGDTATSEDREKPRQTYYGPPPDISAFYNATTFQIHSKGPDSRTDYYDDHPEIMDPCDRGTDPDDINNYGGVYVPETTSGN